MRREWRPNHQREQGFDLEEVAVRALRQVRAVPHLQAEGPPNGLSLLPMYDIFDYLRPEMGKQLSHLH